MIIHILGDVQLVEFRSNGGIIHILGDVQHVDFHSNVYIELPETYELMSKTSKLRQSRLSSTGREVCNTMRSRQRVTTTLRSLFCTLIESLLGMVILTLCKHLHLHPQKYKLTWLYKHRVASMMSHMSTGGGAILELATWCHSFRRSRRPCCCVK
ncbi:uncharacterized protein LOC124885294 [Capsicum annuum]|uniref:uncharacterized protein LOC124885294 n=1 Tax=Capsicum annuum TaxID=4072 RepID=UPI001FB0BF02|nr:uncharacterized protein LOC124885294 [Capsicum annuum]